jgi:hypothetical protein
VRAGLCNRVCHEPPKRHTHSVRTTEAGGDVPALQTAADSEQDDEQHRAGDLADQRAALGAGDTVRRKRQYQKHQYRHPPGADGSPRNRLSPTVEHARTYRRNVRLIEGNL